MKTKALWAIGVVVAALAVGCSSVDSRIARNREAFSSWPAPVQDKVVQGKIDIGFTADQVRVALGEPDRVFTRVTADGTSEIWGFRDRGPKFSFGVGVGLGSYGRHGGTMGGVGINTGGYHDDEKLGIVFDRTGRVASIETREKQR